MKYVNELNCLILIGLLKEYQIKDIVVSPGTTNIPFVVSCSRDPFFNLVSCVDERSAGYLACGMSKQTQRPTVLVCTGATASRNYYPALTEAYYSKIPILAVTCSNPSYKVGNLFPQVTNRGDVPIDVCKVSVELPFIDRNCPEWHANDLVNRALLGLTENGGGPCHINLYSAFSGQCTQDVLPTTRRIKYYSAESSLPRVPDGKVALFIGSDYQMSNELSSLIDSFCDCHDSVVFTDLTSNYRGRYYWNSFRLLHQDGYKTPFTFDLIIHLGAISSTYYSFKGNQCWRVDGSGKLQNYFGGLTALFCMSELFFFRHYAKGDDANLQCTHTVLPSLLREARNIPICEIELPFSNLWIAQKLHTLLPRESNLHLAIFNSLRSWNYFDIDPSIRVFANVGGFGIDGCTSAAVGSALANPHRQNLLITGDLAFFYDMNVLGLRHFPANLKILLINNGCGCEMRMKNNIGSSFPHENDLYCSAMDHYVGTEGKSPAGVFAESLGLRYACARSKEDFIAACDAFLNAEQQAWVMEAVIEEQNDVTADTIARSLYVAQHDNGSKGIIRKLIRRISKK